MSISHKAFALRENIAADLAVVLNLAQVKAFDASSNPILNLGTLGVPATGEQCAVVRVVTETSPFTDVLGLTQDVFVPCIIEVALETSATPTLAFLTLANASVLLNALTKTGCKVKVYLRATGTEPTVADMIASKLVATLNVNNYAPLAGQ